MMKQLDYLELPAFRMRDVVYKLPFRISLQAPPRHHG